MRSCWSCRLGYTEVLTTQGRVRKCPLGLNRRVDGRLDPIEDIGEECDSYQAEEDEEWIRSGAECR